MPKSCPSRPPLPLLLLSSSLFLLHLHRWVSNSHPIELQLEETARRSLTTGGTIDIDNSSPTSRTIALQHCPCKRSVLQMIASKTLFAGHFQGPHSTWKESQSCYTAPALRTLGLEEATKRSLLSPSTVPPTQLSTRRRSTGAESRRTWRWWNPCMGTAGA